MYREAMLVRMRAVEGLMLHEGSVEDLLVEHHTRPPASEPRARVRGVVTAEGAELLAPRVILTTGTFLRPALS